MNTLHPRISEKTFALSQSRNTYVFNVPAEMNRAQVAEMVAKDYNVKVVSVNIAIAKGKAKRFYTLGSRRPTNGTRSDVKKAYVRLAEGNSIPVFASLTEEEKKETAQPEPVGQKRGLLTRKTKATGSTSGSTKVSRTQAKVGEK